MLRAFLSLLLLPAERAEGDGAGLGSEICSLLAAALCQRVSPAMAKHKAVTWARWAEKEGGEAVLWWGQMGSFTGLG